MDHYQSVMGRSIIVTRIIMFLHFVLPVLIITVFFFFFLQLLCSFLVLPHCVAKVTIAIVLFTALSLLIDPAEADNCPNDVLFSVRLKLEHKLYLQLREERFFCDMRASLVLFEVYDFTLLYEQISQKTLPWSASIFH